MTSSERKSLAKLDVRIIKKPEKYWVRAILRYSRTFEPSFCDLYRIIQAIAWCEDQKYPPPAQGRRKLLAFFRDAVLIEPWDRVAETHEIPDRTSADEARRLDQQRDRDVLAHDRAEEARRRLAREHAILLYGEDGHTRGP